MNSFRLAALVATLAFLNACSTLNGTLKAGPIENTNFASQALAGEEKNLVAVPRDSSPFHRAWRLASDSLPLERGNVPVFVNGVDTRHVVDAARREKGFHPASDDVEAVAAYLKRQVENEFRKRGVPIASERPARGLVIDLALVELSSTDIVRNVLGTALGSFFPGGGLVAFRSSGSTGVEGVVRDAATNKPVFVFADRERGKTALFSFYDFSRYAHARAAIEDWARQLVQYTTAPAGTRVLDSSAVTLLQL